MVMEASPSPQSVGREFVRQYYTLLNKAPAHLHRFYNNFSSFVHGGLDAPNRETLPVVGQKQIHHRIQQLNFRDCHAKISQVDAQATLGAGVVVQVTGELSNGGAPMRRFTQTFVLAAQAPKKYYVHNDIFRYQDIVFSDEEGSGSGPSEGEEEEAQSAGYFPAAPPPSAFPLAAFPEPPAEPAAPAPAPAPAPAAPAPAAPPAPAPGPAAAPDAAQPHVNGHPQLEESARHLGAALQAATGVAASEPDVEPLAEATPAAPADPPVPAPAPAVQPAPAPAPALDPPAAAAPPVPAEPKTYANLLKSGSGAARAFPAAAAWAPAPAPSGPAHGGPAQGGPAHSGPAHGAPAPGPAAVPLEQRPRMTRAPLPSGGGGGSGGGGSGGGGEGGARRYSDSQQLFLGNLPHSATEEALRALFQRFGTIAELRVHCKPPPPGAASGAASGASGASGPSGGAPAGPPAPAHRQPNYGFITYDSSQAAQDCLHAAPLYFPADSLEGVKLNVEEKKTRRSPPPRRRAPPSPRGYPRAPHRR